MHRSNKRLIIATTLGSAVTLSGLALAEGSAKSDAANQQNGTNTAAMRAEPTEVAIQASADQVKELQRQLASRGFYQGAIDGVAGAKTRAALRNFQVQQGIATEGGLNAQTRDSLGLDWDRQPVKGSEEPERAVTRGNTDTTMRGQANGRGTAPQDGAQPGQPRSGSDARHVQLSTLTSDQTKEVQERLQELGYYQGSIDGVMGAGTRAAMTRYFQRQAQLASQGMVDGSAIDLFGVEASDVKPENASGVTRSGTAPTR